MVTLTHKYQQRYLQKLSKEEKPNQEIATCDKALSTLVTVAVPTEAGGFPIVSYLLE